MATYKPIWHKTDGRLTTSFRHPLCATEAGTARGISATGSAQRGSIAPRGGDHGGGIVRQSIPVRIRHASAPGQNPEDLRPNVLSVITGLIQLALGYLYGLVGI